MSSLQQPFLANNKATLDNLFAAQNRLFAGFEQLLDVNMQVLKASLNEINEKTQTAADVKDAQQVNQFAMGLVKPAQEQAANYSKDVFDIVSSVQRDLGQLSEAQITQNQQQLNQFIEQAEKNAPAGSESFFALFKAGLLNMTHAADSMVRTSRQFADVAESNVVAASTAAANASQQAAGAVEKTMAQTTKAAKI